MREASLHAESRSNISQAQGLFTVVRQESVVFYDDRAEGAATVNRAIGGVEC